MSESSFPTLLTVAEFARETNICRASVYNMLARGELRSVKIGRSRRIPHAELLRLAGLEDDAA